MLDAGTGLRELGNTLMRDGRDAGIEGDIFISHAHWDHIQGIPFFAPMFHHGNRFTVWGSRALHTSLARVLHDQMSPVVFPVRFEDLSAAIEFREMSEERCAAPGYTVQAFQLRHPGGALGYRFEEDGSPSAAVVYISDNEMGDDSAELGPDWRERFVEFVRGAALLIHDSTYSTDEYVRHRGWGHSTYDEAVTLALDAGVHRLALFHHKPERTDAELDEIVSACRERVRNVGGSLEIIGAAEGLTVEI